MPSKEKKLLRHKRRRLATKLEWQRRQQDKLWLFTHIWHAKRFHMVNRWGYRLPWLSTDKSRLRIYRAAIRSAYVHDATYMECIRLSGKCLKIVELLSKFTDPSLASVGEARYVTGTHRGHQRLHQPNQYPRGFVAPISFFWTKSSDNEIPQSLMIWFHPAAREEVVPLLTGLCTQESAVKVEHLQRRWACSQVRGPRSHQMLQWILRKTEVDNGETAQPDPAWDLWSRWQSVPQSQSLPRNIILALRTVPMPAK